MSRISMFLCCVLLLSGMASCTLARETSPARQDPAAPVTGLLQDKWSLWTNGTQLRGANIFQREVKPDIDGPEFMGPGPFGPPYTQADIDRLAAMGANYVNISHPGLFTESPPFILNETAQANLDKLLKMIAKADMFAVITFRTGPGRNEFSIQRGGAGDWFPPDYLNESIWTDSTAQDAWLEMWRYTAERYRDNPIVVGYDLMCEPNSNDILQVWTPEEFRRKYGDTLYDWNQLFPRITAAIRAVDTNTPILVGGNGYSSVTMMPGLRPDQDPHTVYVFHQYEPTSFTHQDSGEQRAHPHTYPGIFDTDYDLLPEVFNRSWLEALMDIPGDFERQHTVPVAVNEFGLKRWESAAAGFLRDEIDLFEQHGWNYALWQWYPSWPPLAEGDNAFNFRLGPDPNNLSDVPASQLIETIKEFWARNELRPSNYPPH